MIYRPHEYAELFPLMQPDAFVSLKADISKNGLLMPVVVLDGKILDGRNRFKACQEVGVSPAFETYQGNDPLGYVISVNKERRHLTPSQKAACAVNCLPLLEIEAKKRQLRTAENRNLVNQKIDEQEQVHKQPQSLDQAADLFGTNRQYVADAKKIQKESPCLFEKVASGEKTLTAAKHEVKEKNRESLRQANREKISQSGSVTPVSDISAQFPTIVIDPPWDWGDEGDQDQLGRARPDYHTLSFNELLELPVDKLSLPDAHIYLWITNRSLPKGFALLEKWGFRYITCLTWVKPSFGMGNYFRGQTEQVLFGVKGSLPLKRKDVGTVFNAPRGTNGHSSKPVEFYGIVESCSHSPYLEMFSRVSRDGWVAWGENGLNAQ